MKTKISHKQKGITLIALVITIIVLLILASVSIAMLTGENGILTKATSASEQTKKQGALEKVKLAVAGSKGNAGKLSLEELTNSINQIEGLTNIKTNNYPIVLTVDDIEFIIDENGNVDFYSEFEKNFQGIINPPKLGNNMQAVYWDEAGNEVTGDTGSNWYDYGKNKWANAKTEDGSYWVWVPRYAYKITSGLYSRDTGQIDIKFIDTNNFDGIRNYNKTYPNVTADAMDDYVVHPAFTDGTENGFANGEWDKDLEGIWVSKFQIGIDEPYSYNKVFSKPGAIGDDRGNVDEKYKKSLNFASDKGSHMMKNSEWGAILYLSHSKYGRNGEKITENEAEIAEDEYTKYFCTGGGQEDSYKANGNQSTTGNIYGVYDMVCGNTYGQIVPAYLTNGEGINSPTSFVNSKVSTKYATIYPYNTDNDDSALNYEELKKLAKTRYGDAIIETSIKEGYFDSWQHCITYYPHKHVNFFERGFSSSFGITYAGQYVGGYRICFAF